jgi:hypothetical protein
MGRDLYVHIICVRVESLGFSFRGKALHCDT